MSQRSDQSALCTPTCDATRAQEKIKRYMRETPPCLLPLGLRTAKLSICRFTSLMSNTLALISAAVEAREEKNKLKWVIFRTTLAGLGRHARTVWLYWCCLSLNTTRQSGVNEKRRV